MATPTLEIPDYPAPGEFPTDLPYSYGDPLESVWHVEQGSLFRELLAPEYAGRDDIAMCVNMALHYSLRRARNMDFVGPDFFVAFAPNIRRERLYYAVWEEGGKYPDLIVEFLSPTTEANDRGEKFVLYRDVFKTKEYFWIDPGTRAVTGFRLVDGEYVPIEPDANGRHWSEVLQLSFGPWFGEYCLHAMKYVRFFRADGTMLPTGREKALAAYAELAHVQETARQLEAQATAAEAVRIRESARAEAEALRASTEAARARTEAARAAAADTGRRQEAARAAAAEDARSKEAARAAAAEAELAALRAELARLRTPPANPTP